MSPKFEEQEQSMLELLLERILELDEHESLAPLVGSTQPIAPPTDEIVESARQRVMGRLLDGGGSVTRPEPVRSPSEPQAKEATRSLPTPPVRGVRIPTTDRPTSRGTSALGDADLDVHEPVEPAIQLLGQQSGVGVTRPPHQSVRLLRARPPLSLVRVLLCEDEEVFRLGLRVVLEAEPDLAVVAETDHLLGALSATEDVPVQVVVVRQGLVEGASLPLLRDLCRRGTAVLVLAEPREDSGADLVEVLRAGVRGYLPRRSAAARLVEAVRALSRHEPTIDPTATSELVRYLADPSAPAPGSQRALDRLTERQRKVAKLVAEGLSNEEIATQLFLSLATVKSHLTTSMRRLDVRSRTQLAILVNRELSLHRLTAQKLVDGQSLDEDAASMARPGMAFEAAVTGELLHRLDGADRRVSFETASAYSPLTSRQQEVSGLVALGLTDAEIAKSLQISRATVKGHITVVLRRLNLRDRTQLALYIHRAARSGMVSTAEPNELPMEVVDRVVEMVDRFEPGRRAYRRRRSR